MAPPWSCFGKRLHILKVEPFFSLIIMFEKKTVPLTKVVPFAKIFQKKVENGTTFQKVELFWLHCGTVLVPLWSRFSKKKGKKWYHLIKSGAVLKTVPLSLRWYYFGSNLAWFHENSTTLPKRSSVVLL